MGSHDGEPGAAAQSGDLQQSDEDLREEDRKLRRLQLMMNVVMSVIGQDRSMTVDEAAQLIADTRAAALVMFPGKEETYDLLYRPRLQRLMRERYRIQ